MPDYGLVVENDQNETQVTDYTDAFRLVVEDEIEFIDGNSGFLRCNFPYPIPDNEPLICAVQCHTQAIRSPVYVNDGNGNITAVRLGGDGSSNATMKFKLFVRYGWNPPTPTSAYGMQVFAPQSEGGRVLYDSRIPTVNVQDVFTVPDSIDYCMGDPECTKVLADITHADVPGAFYDVMGLSHYMRKVEGIYNWTGGGQTQAYVYYFYEQTSSTNFRYKSLYAQLPVEYTGERLYGYSASGVAMICSDTTYY